jgi:hypothetical protein
VSAQQIQTLVLHGLTLIGLVVLLAMNKIDQTTGIALIAAIVGINTPSPLVPGQKS